MKKVTPAANPDAYVTALDGWRRELVEKLRTSVLAAARLDEMIKWGHLVYCSNGPVLLIRAEEARVLFGFWRGKRLREVEPTLKASGKYEMATVEFHDGMTIARATITKLVEKAVSLNETLGDPTAIDKVATKRKRSKATVAKHSKRTR